MSTIKSLTGKWKGVYIYGPEYESEQGTSVEFTLELKDINGLITGVSIDSETKNLFSEPVNVVGFRDENFISFTIQYPFIYYINEQKQLVVDKTKPHPGVTYSGEYNSEKNSFEGEWDIVYDSQKYGDGYFDDILTGTWSMELVHR